MTTAADTPEVDQQLQQARADLETARANLRQAQITADRWRALLESDSVSKQETDVAVSALSAMKATVDSNTANVGRLEQLQAFEKIFAPFDGVITARNVDIGVLVNAGSTSTSGRELFHMTAIQTLRVFVAVPEVYSRAARPGSPAILTLDEFPGQSFQGTLVRTANAIDLASRTLNVEVDVDNPRGELLPGAYVFVHLKLPRQIATVTVPVNTLLFRAEGLQVGRSGRGRDGRGDPVGSRCYQSGSASASSRWTLPPMTPSIASSANPAARSASVSTTSPVASKGTVTAPSKSEPRATCSTPQTPIA